MQKRRKCKPIVSGLPSSKLLEIQTLCLKHGTSFEKIPAWLLGKPIHRIKFYFKTIESAKPPAVSAEKKAPITRAKAKNLKSKKKVKRKRKQKKVKQPKVKQPKRTPKQAVKPQGKPAFQKTGLALLDLLLSQGKTGLRIEFRSWNRRRQVDKLKKLLKVKRLIEKVGSAKQTKNYNQQKEVIDASIEVLVSIIPKEILKKEGFL